jgi:PAS domain S-box-containing protein
VNRSGPPATEAPPAAALPWWRRRRTTLLAAFLLVAIAVGVTQLADVIRAYRGAEAAALTRQVETARQLAHATELLVARYASIAETAAHTIFDTPLTGDARRRLLAHIRLAHLETAIVTVIGPDGRVVDADPAGAISIDVSDRSYYRQVVGGASSAVSDLVVGNSAQGLYIEVAAAGQGPDGTLRGMVLIGLPAATLAPDLGLRLSGEARSLLVDRTGRIIVHGLFPDLDWARRDVSRVPLVAEVLSGRAARSDRFTSPVTGEPMLGTMVPVPALGWAVGVVQPVEAALAPARQALQRALARIALVLGLGAVLALVLSASLSRPVAALAAGVSAVARGDFGHRVTVRSRDELGLLAGSFNAMATRLEEAMGQQQELNAELAAANQELQANTAQMEETLAELEMAQERALELNAELAAANARLAGIIESAMDPIITIDAEQRITVFNRAAEQVFGRPAAAALGQPIDRFIPERFRRVHAEHIRAFGRMGVTSRSMRSLGTLTGLRADGEEFPIEASISQVDVSGQKFFTVILRDITERERAEEAVRDLNVALERRVTELQTLLSLAPVAIAIAHDPACRRISVNPTFARILGAPSGANASATAPPDERVPYRVYRAGCEVPSKAMPMEVAATTGALVSNVEVEVVRDDGTRFRLLGNAAPLFDEQGHVRGSLAGFMDITERKRIEEAQRFLAEASMMLASSLDYEATLASVARLAVGELADWCVVDLLEADRAVPKTTVAHADPAKEPLARELRRYAPEPPWPHLVSEALRTGRPELVAETTDAWLAAHARNDAHLTLLRTIGIRSAMIVPLLARGQTLGMLTFISAESGRRYGPADLALAEELARRAALSIDNARLYHEAQAAIQARETFLARASHELRTPLTSALGTVRLLKRAATGTLKEPPEVLIDIASRNLGVMADLINNLLDVSKLVSGQETLALEPVEVAAAAAESFEMVGAQARDKGVALRAAVPAGLTVPADRLKLEQVLVNLLANAVKFTPRGGEVGVSAEADEGHVVIRVRDTGEGIAREHLEAIFEPFFQVGQRTARRPRGTGLGLAICRQIVTLHGGRIRAESDGPGCGATFVVSLPHDQVQQRVA